MEKFEKTLKYNNLLRIYGSLLSDTQREIATSYYEYDLSLSEIAEEKSISRSAVEDALKKSMAKLDQLESSLHIFENNKTIESLIENIDEETKENIKRVLDSYGIWVFNR